MTVTLEQLDSAIENLLVGKPMSGGRRLLGIEVEHLILHRESRQNAPLAFCRELLARLRDDLDANPVIEDEVLAKMTTPEFGISMEPGGQIEMDSQPYASLAELERVFTDAMAAIRRPLDGTDYELVAIGHAPQTRIEDLGLLPRRRYEIMDAEMPARGPLTRNMMRATAGFQLAYDFEDRDDAGTKLALINRLSPVLTAITANSRFVGGEDSGWASYRHKVWWETDHVRCGVPEGGLDAETAIDGYVRFARRAIALFRHGPNGLEPTPRRPLEDLVAAAPMPVADLELHLSSLFPFVRPRNYLEVRCFDSLPWPEARSVLALVSGLIYCSKASAAAWELSGCLVVREPARLRALHLDAARRGLDARVGGGPTLRDLARELVGYSSSTLGGPDCDWARVEDLELVRQRIG